MCNSGQIMKSSDLQGGGAGGGLTDLINRDVPSCFIDSGRMRLDGEEIIHNFVPLELR